MPVGSTVAPEFSSRDQLFSSPRTKTLAQTSGSFISATKYTDDTTRVRQLSDNFDRVFNVCLAEYMHGVVSAGSSCFFFRLFLCPEPPQRPAPTTSHQTSDAPAAGRPCAHRCRDMEWCVTAEWRHRSWPNAIRAADGDHWERIAAQRSGLPVADCRQPQSRQPTERWLGQCDLSVAASA